MCRSGNRYSTFFDAFNFTVFIDCGNSRIAAAPSDFLVCRILRKDCHSQLHIPSCFDSLRFRTYRNTGHNDRCGRFIDRNSIRIAFRAYGEQVGRRFLITEIFIACSCAGSIGTLQLAAVDRSVRKRMPCVGYPDIRSVVQFQISMAGIIARFIGCIQIPAVQAPDIIAAVCFLKDPTDVVICGRTGCKFGTRETVVCITAASALSRIG